MYTIKKIITRFLTPPGIFIIPIMLSGMWLLFREKSKVGALNIIIAILMWILSISPVSDALLESLESNFSLPKNPQGDVIILLAGSTNYKAPDLSGIGAPSDYYLSRIVTAIRLQKILNIPIIVSGDKILKSNDVVIPITKRFLADLGVPADKIIIENSSRNTYENASMSAEILKRRYPGEKHLVITSAFHLRRAMGCFRKTGLEVEGFSTDFYSKNRQYTPDKFIIPVQAYPEINSIGRALITNCRCCGK